MKKILTTGVLVLGLAFTAAAADEGKKDGDGKGKGKGGDPAKRVEMFMKADTDGDKKVSKEEFGKSKMAEGMEKRKAGSADKFFAKADADSDGGITKEEATKAMTRQGGKGKGKGENGKKPEDKKES
jgi:hypothetical protein